jgi:RNA polymerase sporulation-specific sigma factor
MTRDELISENLGLVHSCANKFRNRGIEYDDLYSAGCLGLVKAADGFDETLGFRFSTYAVPAILGEIKRLFRDGGAVKVSRSLKEKSREAIKLRDELSVSLGREPTVSELSERLGINEFDTVELLNIAVPPASLTATDEDGERQIDIPVEFGEDQIHNSIVLREIIDKMPEADRRLIELRYYRGLTQTVTAQKLGLSQVQVSRRERSLLQEMRRKMTG